MGLEWILFSGFDQQWGGYTAGTTCRIAPITVEQTTCPDSRSRINMTATGQRSPDIFTVHWYPQEGELFSNDVSTMSMLRNRSPLAWIPTTPIKAG
jgi:hypothetical protein